MPDSTTITKFRKLLNDNKLGEALFAQVGGELQARGFKVNTSSIVDATIIDAPSSTKNADKARDPDMLQTRKGQQWYFGMKCGRPHFMPNVVLVHMWRPAASPSGGLSLSTT